jgi:hypothetical protein
MTSKLDVMNNKINVDKITTVMNQHGIEPAMFIGLLLELMGKPKDQWSGILKRFINTNTALEAAIIELLPQNFQVIAQLAKSAGYGSAPIKQKSVELLTSYT